MATPVWVVLCTVPANVSGNSLGAQCNTADRVVLETSLEALTQQDAIPALSMDQLDPASVAGVFSLAFSVVVLFYLVARGAGSVLRLIRFG